WFSCVVAPAMSVVTLKNWNRSIRRSTWPWALSTSSALWERAVALRFSGADTGPPKTAGEGEDLHRVILKLLAVGLTDREVARQLNLSQRTVQRHVATLMTRLGARTRLQAGVHGIRQGRL